jgi:hypothetical protein
MVGSQRDWFGEFLTTAVRDSILQCFINVKGVSFFLIIKEQLGIDQHHINQLFRRDCPHAEPSSHP